MIDTTTERLLDLADVPFSRSGSWFDISPVIGPRATAEDLHLVSHQNGLHPVLRLIPLVAGADHRASATWTATPGVLRWINGGDRIELVYETPDTVRLRGSGLDLAIEPVAAELTPFTGSYLYQDPVDGSHHFASYETGRRYRVTPLPGTSLEATGGEALGAATRRLRVTRQRGHDSWSVVIEEIASARPPYRPEHDFEHSASRTATEFDHFARAVTGRFAHHAPAAELASYVLWSATAAPAGLLRRPAVLMSKHWMDKVWSWDHCFNALALAPDAPGLAWHQFQLPFDFQDETGALPDSVTHSEVLYNFVKPPIHGWALRRLRERLPHPVDQQELERTYRRLERWTDFWLRMRRAPGETLPHYQHGNDSGWDNATTFDAHRVVIAADLAAFLILQLTELSKLAIELGHAEDASRHARTSDTLLAALLDQLWSGERFLTRPPHTARGTTSRSLLDLMPIVLGERLPDDVSASLAQHIATHLTPHGLATEHPDSPHYEPDGYWRGPIWAPATVLVEDGLRRAGHTTLADEISARFRALCETSGFAENFDAVTGRGLRDRAYTWTASSYLLLADDHARR